MCFLASFLNLLVTLLKVRLEHRYFRHGRKVAHSPGTPGTPETQVPPVPQDPIDHCDPQDLWTLGLPGTSGR